MENQNSTSPLFQPLPGTPFQPARIVDVSEASCGTWRWLGDGFSF